MGIITLSLDVGEVDNERTNEFSFLLTSPAMWIVKSKNCRLTFERNKKRQSHF
jgi:hypothetical protein